VRLAHDCHNCNAAGSPDRLCLQKRCQLVFIVVRKSTDDFHKFRSLRHSIFLSYFMNESIQDNFFSLLVAFNELSDDLCNVF
jgi:hypothetical protein